MDHCTVVFKFSVNSDFEEVKNIVSNKYTSYSLTCYHFHVDVIRQRFLLMLLPVIVFRCGLWSKSANLQNK